MVVNVASHQASPIVLLSSGSPSSPPPANTIPRGVPGRKVLRCSFEKSASTKVVVKHVLSGLAASLLLLSPTNQVLATEVSHSPNIRQLASAVENKITFPLDDSSVEKGGKMMMMRGMTAKDFDPVRYAGRWFEVASFKRGFAGQGQEDCHYIQGVYTFDMEAPAIQVDTFCVHGGPHGHITGIRGKVQCLSEGDLEKNETDLEKQEMMKERCYLRFPTLPFIPKEPYDVIATDYDNFSLVSGAKD